MPSDRYECDDCGSDDTDLAARATDPTPAWPDGTQLVECRDCGDRWAVVNGVTV